MSDTNKKAALLENLLSKTQKSVAEEEFIYGVTDLNSRTLSQRFEDFFIERRSVPTKEKAYFFELLATMLAAGIALNNALKILSKKTSHPRLKRVIATLSFELEHGKPLSKAMERFPEVFDETERGVVASAEAVGHLERMLTRVADNLNNRSDLMMRLKGATIYPIAVLISLVIGIVTVLVFVLPKIEDLFASSGILLPLSTRILLGASFALRNYGWLFFILIIFAVIAFHVHNNSDEGHFSWDFRILRIPLVGELLRKIFVIRFIDTLGMLTESGLPLNRALEFTANAVGNEIYRLKTFEALAAVQEGKPLSRALEASPFLFPETVTNMIAVGEKTASLGDLAQKIGAQYSREIDYSLKNLTTVLGPTLILVIGAAVAFFALSVITPIFSLTQAVS
jgi:type II secretory pathway component PulF